MICKGCLPQILSAPFLNIYPKCNDTTKSQCAYETTAYILYVTLHWFEILTHHCVLRNTTEYLFLNFYYGNLVPALCKLINTIFSSSLYPSNWAQNYLKPMFKKGDSADLRVANWELH